MRSKQRRELRSSIRKSFILDKAEALFWEKGYNGTSMRDIAGACNCKPANIYNFFESKEDILYEVIRDIIIQLLEFIGPYENDVTTDPVELLKQVIKRHFAFLVNMKRSIVSVTDTGLKDLTTEHRKEIIELRGKYDRIVQNILVRGVETGQFIDIDEKMVSYFISSIIIRSNIWYSDKGRLSADQVSDAMFEFVYRGIKA
ncbi:MAG: TetR family transcriptional regulator [Dehalococcoidales bacterium]|nr:TetR family transcriptional regulator [Dehalococcoidales bacterium]